MKSEFFFCACVCTELVRVPEHYLISYTKTGVKVKGAPVFSKLLAIARLSCYTGEKGG